MKKIAIYALLLVTIISIGCDDAKILDNINQSPANYGTLEWDEETGEVLTNYIYRYTPAHDIELKVPEHLVYTPPVHGSLPPGVTSGNVNTKKYSDEQMTLSTYHVGFLDDKIYVPDWRGMKIYAFDLDGNFLVDDAIDRAEISCENYTGYANQSNFGDKVLRFWTSDRLIYMVVSYMWDCTGTNWREDVDKLFIVRINPRSKRITVNHFDPEIPYAWEREGVVASIPFPQFVHNDILYSSQSNGVLKAFDAYSYVPLPDEDLEFNDNYDFWWERGEESKYPPDPGGVLFREFGRAGYGHTYGWTIDPVPPLVSLTWYPELPHKYANGLLWTRGVTCSIEPKQQDYQNSLEGYSEVVEVNPVRALRIEGVDLRNYFAAYDMDGNYTGIFLKPVDCQYYYVEADYNPADIWSERVPYREYAAGTNKIIDGNNNIIYVVDFDLWSRHSDKVNVSKEEGIPATYYLRAYK